MKFLDEMGFSHFIDKLKGMFDKKVDKVEGRGLSTEDYRTEEKNKLAGIEAGANKYVHPTKHPASIITETTTKRFVSDSEKSIWNNKTSPNDVNRQLLSSKTTDYGYPFKETIVIYGESHLYYPVIIRGGNQGIKREIFVRRGYSELAPPDWNTPTHKGDLVLKLKANFGGWGGARYSWEVHEWEEMYSTIFAGAHNTMSNMAFAIYLRGGGETGARYHLYSDQPLDDTRYIQQLEKPVDIPTIGYSTDMMIGKSGQYEWFAPAARTRTAAQVKEITDRQFINLTRKNQSDITQLTNLKADKTYVDNKVLTNVPTNAKFTDTKFITSRTEPNLNTGDEWHKEY